MKIEEEGRKLSDKEADSAPAISAKQFERAIKEPEAPETEGPRGFRRLIREAAAWGEIAKTPYGFGPVIILTLISLFDGLQNAAFGIAGPDIVRDLQVDLTTVVAIGAVASFFGIFANIGIGWWADRHRRVPLLAGGTMLSGVFGLFASRGQTLWGYGTPRVFDGLASQFASVPKFSLLADYYPPTSRGKVFAALQTLGRIEGLGFGVITGALIVAIGWRPTTLMLSVPVIIVGLIAFVFLREPTRGYMERKAFGASEEVARQEEEPLSLGEAWRKMWAVRTLRRLFIAQIPAGGGAALYGGFVAFFITEVYGLNAFQRALIAVPPQVGALIGGFLGGGLIDAFTKRNPGRVLRFAMIMAIVSALGQLALVFRPPLAFIVISSTVLSFAAAISAPATAVVTVQVVPASIRTQGIQTFALVALPAQFIFVPIGIQIFNALGYAGVIAAGVPFLILGAIILGSASGTFELDMRAAFAQALANEEWRKAKASGKGKLLVSRAVDVEYDGVQVVFGADFDVEEGEVIAVLGTNGAGKSTLLKAISGTQEASGGAIVFDGRDITHMPPHEVASRGIVHMPGGRGVFPTLSVRENLLLGRWLLDDPVEARTRLREVYDIFPVLKARANEPAGALSGGEQQMLSLAQAFLSKPKLLMIDELSLGLSPAVVAQLLEIVREINRRGVTIIIVEQSVSVALNIAQKAIFMEKGEVRFVGNTADLLSRPDILRAVYVKGTGAMTGEGSASGVKGERELRGYRFQEASTVLKVEGLTKRFGGITAVNNVSFDLREGEVLGLIGPNGAGKTTIFDLISGYQIPDAGAVFYEGVDITGVSPEERARRKLVRRFQDARLFPSLTVIEALLVSLDQRLELRNSILQMTQLPGPRRAERRVRVRADRLIELLGLESYRDKFVRELSTGVRRVLDLACVLASEPRLLLLDEPSTGIAQAEAEGLGPLLLRVRAETGCSILIIEHTMSLISAVSDELLALDQGQVVMRGTPEEVLNDERVIESYLGGSEASVNR